MTSTLKFPATILAYFAIALLLAPASILSLDTYYYWDWSRHLSWSYYDGSPMIAYFIKASTFFWGDTLFALSFVGLVVTFSITWIIYKTARLFLDKHASAFAALIWLWSPLVTLDLLKETTYDAPLTLFWTLIVYDVIKYITLTPVIRVIPFHLYRLGALIGLLLLSKYSGMVLIIAMVFFLLLTSYRRLFCSLSFYVAIMIALLFFLPVLVWNYQHDWLSFKYQWNAHTQHEGHGWGWNLARAWLTIILPSLNFLFIPLLVCWIRKCYKNNLPVFFCMIVCTVYLFFYGLMSGHTILRVSWMAPYLVTAALLAGVCFQRSIYQKGWWSLLIIYGLISLSIMVSRHPAFSIWPSKKIAYVQLMQAFNAIYPDPPAIILTSEWEAARLLFFMDKKPFIYTVPCGLPENQYALWSKAILQKIKKKTLHEALYVDTVNRGTCIRSYFTTCEQWPTLRYENTQEKKEDYALYLYHCVNKV